MSESGIFSNSPEEDLDVEAFNIQEEIKELKGGVTPKPEAPIVTLKHVQERKEALDIGMKFAYRNFKAACEVKSAKGPVIGAAPSINVWDYLPRGYDPAKDKPIPPKYKARRSGTRPGRQQKKCPQPPTLPRKAASTFARGTADSGGTRVREKINEDDNGKFSSHLVETHSAEKAAAAAGTGRAETTDQGVNDEGKGHEMLVTWQEEQALRAKSAEQRAAEEASLERVKMRIFLVFPFICSYLNIVHKSFLHLKYKRESGAIKLQHFYRRSVVRFVFRRYWTAVQWPLQFILKTRILRKRYAIQKLRVFAREHTTGPPMISHVKKFFARVRQSTHLVKSFLAINHARTDLIERFWVKTEKSARKTIAIREAKYAAKLKREQKERMLASTAMGRRGAGNTHAKWLAKENEVQTILARSDMVQWQYRGSRAVTNHILGENDDEEDIDEVSKPESSTISTSKAEKEQQNEEDLNLIPVDERRFLIKKHLHEKRGHHIRNIIADSEYRQSNRGVITVSDVKTFLRAQIAPDLKARRASILTVTNHMTNGLHRINKQCADNDLPRLRNGFMPLTAKDIGPSWTSIVYNAVQKDLKKLST